MSLPSYQQPEKQFVRQSILTSAVESLTIRRKQAPLVLENELQQVLEFALQSIGDPSLVAPVAEETEKWLAAYRIKVGTKRAADLKVLYLCGPEPMNDLTVLTALGVNPNNVWAVESGREEFKQAIRQVAESGTAVKVHHGNLGEFFEHFPETFDLVYYDACGPFAGGKPNTLDPILRLFAGARLEPLSALITNFSDIPGEKADRFAQLIGAYFRYRYRDLPKEFWGSGLDPAICQADDRELVAFIKSNPAPFYSDFITRLLTDLARYWIPNCRALCIRSVFDAFLASKKQVAKTLEAARNNPTAAPTFDDWIRSAGDMILSPSTYPLLSFFNTLKAQTPPDPLVHQLEKLRVSGQEAGQYIAHASMLDHVVEGHWECLSEHMLNAIRQAWFDRDGRFSCDTPMPNLLINSLLGA